METTKLYYFRDLQKRYAWSGGNGRSVAEQVDYAQGRGLVIIPVIKVGATKFQIIEDNTLLPGEVWKRYENKPEWNVEVSNKGRVRRINDKKLIGSLDGSGYISIERERARRPVHRLVMETFCPIDNPESYVVDHINGKRTDNRLENLRWTTQKANCIFRDEHWGELSPYFH